MRTIKFRGWDIKESQWVKADFFVGSEGFIMWSDESIMQYPEAVIVQQYTGLKDKNGKEIFEGDILNVPISSKCERKDCSYINQDEHGNKTYINCDPKSAYVEYRKQGYIFVRKEYDKPFWVCYEDIKKYEIIGNIHENPELLK